MHVSLRSAGGAVLLLASLTITAAAQQSESPWQFCTVKFRYYDTYGGPAPLFLSRVHRGTTQFLGDAEAATRGSYSPGKAFFADEFLSYFPIEGSGVVEGWVDGAGAYYPYDNPIYEFIIEEHSLGLPESDQERGNIGRAFAFLCTTYADRERAVAAREAAVAKLESNRMAFAETSWTFLRGDTVAAPARPAPVVAKPEPRRRAAITVAEQDTAFARELEAIRRRAYEDEKRAIAARERQQAMDKAIQEEMLERNLEIKRRSAEHLARVQERRAACKAGDRAACNADPARSGAKSE